MVLINKKKAFLGSFSLTKFCIVPIGPAVCTIVQTNFSQIELSELSKHIHLILTSHKRIQQGYIQSFHLQHKKVSKLIALETFYTLLVKGFYCVPQASFVSLAATSWCDTSYSFFLLVDKLYFPMKFPFNDSMII